MGTEKRALVAIGAARLDVIARPAYGAAGRRGMGDARVEAGGTACNCAINWAATGRRARLVSAFGDGPLAAALRAHVDRHGVDAFALPSDGAPVGVYSAHIDGSGRVLSALESHPLPQGAMDASVLARALKGCSVAVLDCNLHPDSVAQAARAAKASGCSVWLDSVSWRSAPVFTRCAAAPIDGVCVSRMEAEEILGGAEAEGLPLFDLAALLASRLGIDALMIDTPPFGAAFAQADGGGSDVSWDDGSLQADTVGARDALLAEFSASLAEGLSPGEALRRAASQAAIVMASRSGNLGEAAVLEGALSSLERQAHHDPLTGLLNRAGLFSKLSQGRRGADRMGFALVDVDRFKSINDELGHGAGDDALRAVAAAVASALRDGDLACRWGGEEILAVVRASTPAEVAAAAERVRVAVESATILPERRVTVSVGSALALQGEAPADTVARADSALYRAKEGGRNRVESADL